MERKVGEVFEYNGEKYVVAHEKRACDGCAFFTSICNSNLNITGHCLFSKRKDRNGVIFVKLKTNDMEERTIKLSLDKAKEFYEKGGEFRDLALSVFSEKELKEITLPKTWKEFCNQNDKKEGECFINISCFAITVECSKRQEYYDRNILPNKQAAKQHLALMQLHQLRDCYRQGWVPNLNNDEIKYCIYKSPDFKIIPHSSISRFLSFQSKEIAEEFLYNFRDLIEQTGDLV